MAEQLLNIYSTQNEIKLSPRLGILLL